MFREYKPTCVEVLFGKPPTRFKAQVVVPEGKDLNLDMHQCECRCSDRSYRPQKTIESRKTHYRSNSEDSANSDNCFQQCWIPCPNIKQDGHRNPNHLQSQSNPLGAKANNAGYQDYSTPSRRHKKRLSRKARVDLEPPCRLCEEEERKGRRFCSVCRLWVKAGPSEFYSSSHYEVSPNEPEFYEERDEQRRIIENACTPVARFMVESCKICGEGNRQPAADVRNIEDKSQQLQICQQLAEDMSRFDREIEERTQQDGIFATPQHQAATLVSGSDDNCEGNVCKIKGASKEISIMKREGDRSAKITNQNKLAKKFLGDNAPSHSSNDARRGYLSNTSANDLLSTDVNEEYSEKHKPKIVVNAMINPLKDKTKERVFLQCSCEYANKPRNDEKRPPEVKMSEIKIIKQKCDEALAKVDQCKKEIMKNKEAKCHCNESTLMLMEEFKERCSQMERQMLRLQQTLNYYASSMEPKMKQHEEHGKGRRLRWDRGGSPGKDGYKSRERGATPSRARSRPKRKDPSTKPRQSPSRQPRITCHHLRCFPPEQLHEIESFKDCPGLQEMSQQQYVSGRRVV